MADFNYVMRGLGIVAVSCSSPPAGWRTLSCHRRVVVNRAAFAFPSRRSLPLQREMVELSDSTGRASAARHRASTSGTRGRSRGLLEHQVEPRLGDHRARAHRFNLRWPLPLEAPSNVRRTGAPSDARGDCVCSGPHRRDRRGWARVLAVPGTDDRGVHLRPAVRSSHDVPMFRSYAVSESSCSSWRCCWRVSGWTISAGSDQARADRVPRPSLTAGEYAVAAFGPGATCCPRRRTAGWRQPGRVRRSIAAQPGV